MIATVSLDIGSSQTFDYAIPRELQGLVEVGSFVEVPLKSTLKKGTVLALKSTPSPYSLKPIQRLLSDAPILSPELLKLSLWISSYYCTPLPQVLPVLIPSSIRGKSKPKVQFEATRGKPKEELLSLIPEVRKKSHLQAEILEWMLKVRGGILLTELLEKTGASRSCIEALVKKGLIHLEKVQIERSPLVGEEYIPSKPKNLTDEQKEAMQKIHASLDHHRFETHLLFGVTGSGKTEIYLQAISKALELGKGTILLVPEIALTAQTIERFRSRFEGHIAVLHHRLSDGERHDEWKRIEQKKAKIVIGARSAIFCPMPNPGLIIVDEEHESSYKQTDSSPTYHARDVAVMRGALNQATVLLGSATPSLESYYNAQSGKYTLSLLKGRPESTKLPEITIIDMKPEYEKQKGLTIFSEALLSKIEKRIQKGEQSILFLNRRGYHSHMLCKACGLSVKCPACELSLTFHKGENYLACHMCGYTASPPPKHCPACKAPEPLKFRGVGTEQVEAALYAIFPGIRVLRLDADSAKHKGSHQKIYRAFRTGKADVLIGTQMIAKGLHFPEVTLVGILNSDSSLNIPDYKSGETTFQLITQVAGRAGRGILPGEVIIQTSIPDNSIIQHASNQNFETFYQEEIQARKLFKYPPFAKLAKLRFSGKDLSHLYNVAALFRNKLIPLLTQECDVSIIDPPAHAKIKEEHRLQFIVKGPKIEAISRAIAQVRQEVELPRSMRLLIDINPTSTFF